MNAFPTLDALSPLDGRYRASTAALAAYFSESAIIRYRIRVEVAYFEALTHLGLPGYPLPPETAMKKLHALPGAEGAASRVKEIEAVTNHDVKAVEYYLREAFDTCGLSDYKELIHFGLTSQDINNTAFPMAIRDAWTETLRPLLKKILDRLLDMAREWKDVPMLARTHGQPATPTILGKEILVFHERLAIQQARLEGIPFSGKFGGATGNFNAHHIAYPGIDWPAFADRFLRDQLGLQRQQVTTQIEHYDDLAAFFDALKRINTILTDLCRDMWTYISMDYFGQKVVAGEVGSSAMPHKVNPIDFENAEGNLGLANALLEHLSAKLPISRLQRDLTDSTVIRNIGVPLGHSMLAWKALLRGLGKVHLHEEHIRKELDAHPEVLAEAIQSVLRAAGADHPYERLKGLTRGTEKISIATLREFIRTLNLDPQTKERLLRIMPTDYTGMHPWKTGLGS